jgi:hypothetical protein
MGRKLKFRAYCLDSKKYLSGDFSLGIESSEFRGKYGEVFKNVIVEQFTGLTDKNGVEIYEGDLLHRNLGVNWKVKFKNSGWIADGNDSGLYLSANQFDECEVIGNIHEK